MGVKEIEAFLTHLAVNRRVAASTQNQALNALMFLYKKVLHIDISDPINSVRAKRPARLPIVLSKDETLKVIDLMTSEPQLIVKLLYGSGLRLMECLRLRVKDVDFSMNQIIVRHGKGGKDRITILPANVIEPLSLHLKRVQALHKEDCEGTGMSTSLEHWPGSIPMPLHNGVGSTCFHPSPFVVIRDLERSGDITFMKAPFENRLKRRQKWRGFTNPSVATPSATASPPICWKPAMISVQCRNCSATKMFPRR